MAKKKTFSGLAATLTANASGTYLTESAMSDMYNAMANNIQSGLQGIQSAPLNQQLGQQLSTGGNSIPNNGNILGNGYSYIPYPSSPQPVPGLPIPGQLGGGYYPQQPTINSGTTFLGGSSFYCVDCPEPKPGMQQTLAAFMFKGDSLCKQCFDGRRKRKTDLELILEEAIA